MTEDLFSLRVVVVAQSDDDQDLFRRAAASAPVPIDLIAAKDAAAARATIAGGADLVMVDGNLPAGEIAQCAGAARVAAKPPFTILLSEGSAAEPFDTDGLAPKPAELEDAKRLIERAVRLRLPSRVLVVDDSATMRSIVRKLLAGTRFPLEVVEVDEGLAALKLVRDSEVDLVFLDYNMPGFSGLETLAELRREKHRVHAVIMTSVTDDSLAERAREQGAAFLKKPFYPADIEALLCRFYGLRAINPKRA